MLTHRFVYDAHQHVPLQQRRMSLLDRQTMSCLIHGDSAETSSVGLRLTRQTAVEIHRSRFMYTHAAVRSARLWRRAQTHRCVMGQEATVSGWDTMQGSGDATFPFPRLVVVEPESRGRQTGRCNMQAPPCKDIGMLS